MVLEILYKICLALMFILVILWFFLHLYYMGSYPETNFSLYYEEVSPVTENIIAYESESNINN